MVPFYHIQPTGASAQALDYPQSTKRLARRPRAEQSWKHPPSLGVCVWAFSRRGRYRASSIWHDPSAHARLRGREAQVVAEVVSDPALVPVPHLRQKRHAVFADTGS